MGCGSAGSFFFVLFLLRRIRGIKTCFFAYVWENSPVQSLSLSRLTASSVAKFPVKMWVVIAFEICLRLTALDLILKKSESLASLRA